MVVVIGQEGGKEVKGCQDAKQDSEKLAEAREKKVIEEFCYQTKKSIDEGAVLAFTGGSKNVYIVYFILNSPE